MTNGDCYSSYNVTISWGGKVLVSDKNSASDLQKKEETIEDAIFHDWVLLDTPHDLKLAREA
jgi:hypothetical protein